jgi:hypothetical protein
MSRPARWVALATAIAAAVSLAVAVTSPARSGPNCRGSCIGYPYTDAAAFVPRDYLWMYPATLVCVLAVGIAVCVHAWTPANRAPLALAGVCFAAIGAGALVVDYGVQLTVAQPALLRGEIDGLSVWSQYNPHGIFIALEDIGYATMAIALLLLGLVLWAGKGSGSTRVAAWAFTVAGAATLILLPVLATAYRSNLDYRFEVYSVVITWLGLICGGLALSLRRRGTSSPRATT